MSEIRFIDTTLRDGQQSLWALGMPTAAMLGIVGQMDRCGFESMEFFSLHDVQEICPGAEEESLGLAAPRKPAVRQDAAPVSRQLPRLPGKQAAGMR